MDDVNLSVIKIEQAMWKLGIWALTDGAAVHFPVPSPKKPALGSLMATSERMRMRTGVKVSLLPTVIADAFEVLGDSMNYMSICPPHEHRPMRKHVVSDCAHQTSMSNCFKLP